MQKMSGLPTMKRPTNCYTMSIENPGNYDPFPTQ
jgi:hypothetical protein